MDLATMRTIIRRDLRDEQTPYRWSDAELDRHIAHAVNEYSEALPLPAKALLPTTPGSREIDISLLTDRIMVEAIEYPVGRFPPSYQRFALWGDGLTLYSGEVPDGANCNIYYGTRHTLDDSGSTVPTKHEDLLAIGAGGYAAIEWAIFTIDRVNVGGEAVPGDFLNWGRERLNYFGTELGRLGRRHQVRVSSLYQPYYPLASKSTDYGP
jgi:hypothetical protein